MSSSDRPGAGGLAKPGTAADGPGESLLVHFNPEGKEAAAP